MNFALDFLQSEFLILYSLLHVVYRVPSSIASIKSNTPIIFSISELVLLFKGDHKDEKSRKWFHC